MADLDAPSRPRGDPAESGAGYEEDFFRWTERQAALMRAGRTDLVDWENVAEEIESLGRRDRRAVKSRLRVLIMHLLKWRAQPQARSGSWRNTIRTQRAELRDVLADSPSLRRVARSVPAKVYPLARTGAADETGLELAMFAEECPFTAEQVLDDDFWPEDGPGR